MILHDIIHIIFGDSFVEYCEKFESLLATFGLEFDDLDVSAIADLFKKNPDSEYLYTLLVYALLDFEDTVPMFIKNYDVKDSENLIVYTDARDYEVAVNWAKVFSDKINMDIEVLINE